MANNYIDISVIIPCYNEAETVLQTLEAVSSQQYDKKWEIIFSDNGSTDDSQLIAASFKDNCLRLHLIDSSAERGRAFPLNNGIKHAAGKSILICDADDLPLPGWLQAMGRALESHPIVACKTDTTELNPPLIRKLRKNIQENGLNTLPYPPYCEHAGGGTMGFHREVFKEIGGFDSTFPFLQDTDFCIRAHLAGYRITFVQDAVLCYRLRSDPRTIFHQSMGYALYNLALAKKYNSTGRAPGRRWRKLLAEIKGVTAAYFTKGESELNRLRFAQRLGRVCGMLIGIFKFMTPPC